MSDAALPPPSRPWKRRLRNALIVVFTLAVAFVASATMTGFKVADRVPGPPLLEFDELAVDVSSTSLWRGAPVLDTLKVSRPRIALTRNADGTYNIQDVIDTVDDEALRALANQRAQSVKSWLTDQGGVASKRMFLVASKLDAAGVKDGGAPTRVDFALK